MLDKENVKFIILCSPHNPVGRVWTREELVALAGACRDRGILVIVDEVWADWCWKPFTPFHPVATDMGCKCISLGSPTKTWNLAGFHCSYAIFDDKAMLKKFKEYVQPQFLDHGSTFGTEALQIAYESKEWMYGVRDYVKANFAYLAECLKDIPGIKLVPCIAQVLVFVVQIAPKPVGLVDLSAALRHIMRPRSFVRWRDCRSEDLNALNVQRIIKTRSQLGPYVLIRSFEFNWCLIPCTLSPF